MYGWARLAAAPRLQLERGILYYRLGSYEVSRSYFAQVSQIGMSRPK